MNKYDLLLMTVVSGLFVAIGWNLRGWWEEIKSDRN